MTDFSNSDSPSRRITEFSADLQSEMRKQIKGKRGRPPGSTSKRKPKNQVLKKEKPSYEEVANWRGIERVLVDTRQESRPITNLPGSVPSQSWPVNPNQAPVIGHSPEELVARNRPEVVVPDMETAISSAVMALKPYLRRIVDAEVEQEYSGNTKLATADTINQYREKAEIVIRQYCAQYGMSYRDEEIQWPSLAEWFLSRRIDMKPETWKMYRNAMVIHLTRIPTEDAEFAISVLKTDDESEGIGPKGKSRRIKKFDPDDYDRALYYTRVKTNSMRSQILDDYLRSNIRIGLRPWEFMTSEIRVIPDTNAPYERQIWLFTCNAKFHEHRMNGPIRSIDLSELNNAAVEPIWRTIETIRLQHQIIGYRAWLIGVNTTLAHIYKINQMKNRYTAYSLRHQAIANWKSIYTPVEVAALAGHATPETASQHYGAARDAWPKERLEENMIVRPSQADIERINARLEMAEQRRNKSIYSGMGR